MCFLKASTFLNISQAAHRRWYEFHSHHFPHAVRPCKPPVLLHGKAAARHRKTPYRAAQRLSVWVHASEKIPKFIFFVLPLWTDARNLVPVSRTGCGISFLPFARVSRFATPFCTTPFQGVRQSYALVAGDWATN